MWLQEKGGRACLCQGCVNLNIEENDNENDLCSTTEGEDTTDESDLSNEEEYIEEEIITEDLPVFDTCYEVRPDIHDLVKSWYTFVLLYVNRLYYSHVSLIPITIFL